MDKEVEAELSTQVLEEGRSKAWKLNRHDVLGACAQTTQPEQETYVGSERK